MQISRLMRSVCILALVGLGCRSRTDSGSFVQTAYAQGVGNKSCTFADLKQVGGDKSIWQQSSIQSLERMVFIIPSKDSPENAGAHLVPLKNKGNGEINLPDALDLYDRRGRLAQVSGGSYTEENKLIIAFRAFFDVNEDSRKGFIEITENIGNLPVIAQGQLICNE